MKLSEMRQVLGDRGIQLTKSLGQNFLHDHNQLARITEAAGLIPGEKALEIGPGLGPLTEHLLAAGAEVLAIEKDRRLCEWLSTRFAGESRFRLECGDALDYLRDRNRSWAGWKMVSNLPYSVGSPILVEISRARRPPDRIVATLQLEVVERLMANAADEHYGILSLLIQIQYLPNNFFKIPRGCFFPEPEVDSGCIALDRREPSLLAAELIALFDKIVKAAFSQRRKMALKLLKAAWRGAPWESLFEEAGVARMARAEVITLPQYVRLCQLLSSFKTASPLPHADPLLQGRGDAEK